jgi:hypothetical protein
MDELPEFGVAVAALHGHFILTSVQGHPYQGAVLEAFVHQLADMVAAVSLSRIAARSPFASRLRSVDAVRD